MCNHIPVTFAHRSTINSFSIVVITKPLSDTNKKRSQIWPDFVFIHSMHKILTFSFTLSLPLIRFIRLLCDMCAGRPAFKFWNMLIFKVRDIIKPHCIFVHAKKAKSKMLFQRWKKNSTQFHPAKCRKSYTIADENVQFLLPKCVDEHWQKLLFWFHRRSEWKGIPIKMNVLTLFTQVFPVYLLVNYYMLIHWNTILRSATQENSIEIEPNRIISHLLFCGCS